MKDPDEVLVPCSDLILVVLRENEPEDCVPFALLADLPLHIGDGSGIDKWIAQRHLRLSSGSRSQIPNRIQDGLVELVQLFPLQPSMEYLTHVTAIPPKVDIIPVVGHCVLNRYQSAVRLSR